MDDLISRAAAIDAICNSGCGSKFCGILCPDVAALKALPSVQLEPLTDKEQMIFLAAMEREEKVCEEVDRNFIREPYEVSLMRVCKEIRRKVKGVLWGT